MKNVATNFQHRLMMVASFLGGIKGITCNYILLHQKGQCKCHFILINQLYNKVTGTFKLCGTRIEGR